MAYFLRNACIEFWQVHELVNTISMMRLHTQDSIIDMVTSRPRNISRVPSHGQSVEL